MKNFLITCLCAMMVYACGNAPKVSESTSKVQEMKTWVDSIKAIVDTTTIFDSARWDDLNAQFQNALAGINIQELDEASKATFDALQQAFNDAGAQFKLGIERARTKASELANTVDSTASDKVQTIIEKVTDKAETKKAEGKAKVEEVLK